MVWDWVVWDELCEMSCVWDELCVRWVAWDEWYEMTRGVRWVVWISGAGWVVWDELCEMSGVRWGVWDRGVGWVVWDELCEMSCVRWVVWDEWCEMKGVRWVVWDERYATNGVRWPMKGVRWLVWDEWCEMSGVRWVVWTSGVGWVVWDEWYEMSGVRWVVWDEGCEMSGVGWAVWDELCEKRQNNCGDAGLSQRHLLRKRQYNCGNTDLSHRHLLCKRQYKRSNTGLSQRHLLCKRQYNCGNTDLSQRRLLCKRPYNCGDTDLSQRHLLCKRPYNCGDTDLSQRHLLRKRQYNCGNTDLSHRHLLCKRQYNCGNTDLSQRHLLCKRPYNCGDADLSQRHLLCKRPYNCGDTDLSRRQLFCKHQKNSDDKPAAATAATIRAAAPSGSSVYCACHAKSSRGHCGDNPRRSSFRRLCLLRLPHKEQPRPLRRQSAPQLLQEALSTAPATHRAAAATPATIRAAAPSGSSVYCACHTKSSRGHSGDNPRRSSFRTLCVLRLPHKEQPRPLRRQSAPQLLQEALCTAPATQRAAAATPATIRAAAPSGSSVYCACHTKSSRGHAAPQLLQEALCTAPATQRAAAATAATIRAAAPSGGSVYCAFHTQSSRGHSGDNPRRSSVRKLCVLRLPHEEQPRPLRRQSAPQLLQDALCTAPATQRAAAATPATIRAAAPSGRSVYCACHTKSSRGHCGDNPRRSSFRRLCVLRLPHKEQPRPLRRQSAPQLLQEALCTAPATQRAAAATPATIRAAPPSGRSVYCACHTKSSRGHSGDNPRRSSFRKLCVLRLPHEEQPRPLRRQSAPQLLQDALCTAPATQRAAAATPATIRAAPPSEGSVYCACQATRLWDEVREKSCVRWVVWDELRWVVCEMSCVWDELCVRWVVCDELCEMSGVWDELCEMNCVWDELCEMSCVRWVVCEMNCVRERGGGRRRTTANDGGRRPAGCKRENKNPTVMWGKNIWCFAICSNLLDIWNPPTKQVAHVLSSSPGLHLSLALHRDNPIVRSGTVVHHLIRIHLNWQKIAETSIIASPVAYFIVASPNWTVPGVPSRSKIFDPILVAKKILCFRPPFCIIRAWDLNFFWGSHHGPTPKRPGHRCVDGIPKEPETGQFFANDTSHDGACVHTSARDWQLGTPLKLKETWGQHPFWSSQPPDLLQLPPLSMPRSPQQPSAACSTAPCDPYFAPQWWPPRMPHTPPAPFRSSSLHTWSKSYPRRYLRPWDNAVCVYAVCVCAYIYINIYIYIYIYICMYTSTCIYIYNYIYI